GDLEGRFGDLDSPFGDLHGRFGDLDSPFGDLHGRFGDLDSPFGDLHGRFGDLQGRTRARALRARDGLAGAMPDEDELAALLAHPPTPTRRPTVPALEERLFRVHPVLDHGFVRVVDYMGDDAAIVQAARVSYGTGTRSVRDDRGLIRYLMRNHHSTP